MDKVQKQANKQTQIIWKCQKAEKKKKKQADSKENLHLEEKEDVECVSFLWLLPWSQASGSAAQRLIENLLSPWTTQLLDGVWATSCLGRERTILTNMREL